MGQPGQVKTQTQSASRHDTGPKVYMHDLAELTCFLLACCLAFEAHSTSPLQTCGFQIPFLRGRSTFDPSWNVAGKLERRLATLVKHDRTAGIFLVFGSISVDEQQGHGRESAVLRAVAARKLLVSLGNGLASITMFIARRPANHDAFVVGQYCVVPDCMCPTMTVLLRGFALIGGDP